jgi:hypothetical protein
VAFRVGCISAVDGARGEEVAPAVAQALGYRLVDEEIVRKAAHEANVDISQVAEVEKRRSMAIRLLDSLGSNTSLATFAMAGYVPGQEAPVESDLRGLIRTTIEEVAQRGEAVIVARAASTRKSRELDVVRAASGFLRQPKGRGDVAPRTSVFVRRACESAGDVIELVDRGTYRPERRESLVCLRGVERDVARERRRASRELRLDELREVVRDVDAADERGLPKCLPGVGIDGDAGRRVRTRHQERRCDGSHAGANVCVAWRLAIPGRLDRARRRLIRGPGARRGAGLLRLRCRASGGHIGHR